MALPRRAVPQDISSSILNRIDAATNQTLNAQLARSWLADLDDNIASINQRIRDKIQSNLTIFESQLVSSKSVRERLQTLKADVDTLHETVHNPETGLIPTVTRRLAMHAALGQGATNAAVYYRALSHLSNCWRQYSNLESLARAGKLPDAVLASKELSSLLNSASNALERTKVMADIKRNARATEASVEEQLSDAFARGVCLSRHELLICPSVQVRNSETTLSLSPILSALSNESLNNHLTILRRDLTKHFIDHALKEPCSVAVHTDNSGQAKLTYMPSLLGTENLSSRLANLCTLLDFLTVYLFPHLPPSHWSSFSRALCKILSNSVLDNLLRPYLPSSFDGLSPYLLIVQNAVEFEEKYLVGFLGGDVNDRVIHSWADGIGGHYERQRRVQILDLSRAVILAPGNAVDDFWEEIELTPESSMALAQDLDSKDEGDDNGFSTDNSEDAWGLGDDVASGNECTTAVADSWGFDDDAPEPEVESNEHTTVEDGLKTTSEVVELDSSNAWGWNDANDQPVEDSGDESAWDDPWADQFEESSVPEVRLPRAPSISQPKVASRLEKMASKNKKVANTSLQPSNTVSSVVAPQPSSSPTVISPSSSNTEHLNAIRARPSKSKIPVIKESYRVSGRMTHLSRLVQDVISEGRHLSGSKVLPPPSSNALLGTIILQTAPSTLDLFRALYPVKFSKELEIVDGAMAFSNDCLYLSLQVQRLLNGPAQGITMLKDKFEECKLYFKVLSESWYDDVIERQKQTVDKILVDGARGFMDSADQDRYDECEAAINQVLKEIKFLANKWKGLLRKSKYYSAIGSVTEGALSRILDDILALDDIPEVESHRLSELCRILNALEGLFVEDHSQPSFVLAYVPSWLKFSYLSELLEASMADITYLFEVGALVDFNVDELVQLVRALFADTNLRTTTINKILAGHPTSHGNT